MARIAPINYQGPNREYVPTIGDLRQNPAPTSSTTLGKGYSDLSYLLDLLETIKQKTVTIYKEAEKQLQDFGLVIDQNNTALTQAQASVYPGSDVPPVISFEEFKYLQINNNSNAAQYIISSYEASLRGPAGTNALDISDIASFISNEITRIKDFIDEYIGEVDDTSEQRTIELFQDWAEDTSAIIDKFWQALKGEISSRLPQSELDQLTPETASQFQALLQVKLNKINGNINDLKAQFVKNWENTSAIFYSKHLGPALRFQLKVGRNLSYKVNLKAMPIISNEIVGTMAGVDSNFSGVLADQIKRNKMFIQTLSEIILNIAQRDTYFTYMKNLSSLGKPLPVKFTNSSNIEHPNEILQAASIGVEATTASDLDFNDNFDPIHSSLTGLEDPLAHPQYLLRSGGLESIVTGDIYFEPGVRIDGIVPSTHKHNGIDGSAKITGADIDYNSISEENINTTDPTTSIPENLTLVTQNPYTLPPGIVKVIAEVSFDVTTADNITGYEFEIIKLNLDTAESFNELNALFSYKVSENDGTTILNKGSMSGHNMLKTSSTQYEVEIPAGGVWSTYGGTITSSAWTFIHAFKNTTNAAEIWYELDVPEGGGSRRFLNFQRTTLGIYSGTILSSLGMTVYDDLYLNPNGTLSDSLYVHTLDFNTKQFTTYRNGVLVSTTPWVTPTTEQIASDWAADINEVWFGMYDSQGFTTAQSSTAIAGTALVRGSLTDADRAAWYEYFFG